MLLVAESISQLKWLCFESAQRLRDLDAFDCASRGPWGVAMFMWSTNGKAWTATSACFLTVAALGFESAAQQMLSFSTRSGVRYNETARLGITSKVQLKDIGQVGTPFPWPSKPFQTAIINSLAGESFDVLQECSTSQCSFRDFTSLAVCAACNDISTIVRLDESYECPEIIDANHCLYEDYTTYTYTAPDPFFEPVNLTLFNYRSTYGRREPSPGFGLSVKFDANSLDTRRAGFLAVNITDVQDRTRDVVTACSWSWCERRYVNASIINSKLTYTDGPISFLDVSTFPDPRSSNQYRLSSAFSTSAAYVTGIFDDQVVWAYLHDVLNGVDLRTH